MDPLFIIDDERRLYLQFLRKNITIYQFWYIEYLKNILEVKKMWTSKILFHILLIKLCFPTHLDILPLPQHRALF